MCSQDMYRKYEMSSCSNCKQGFNENQNVIAQTEYVRKVRCQHCGTVQTQVKCQYATNGGMCLFDQYDMRACLEEKCPFAHSCKGCENFIGYCKMGRGVTCVDTPVFPCSYRRDKK